MAVARSRQKNAADPDLKAEASNTAGQVRATLSSEQFQAISRALAEPRRFEMLEQIASCGAVMCGALHVQDCISPATISHHLKELQEAGLIEAERNGRQMNLRLRRPVWAAYLEKLRPRLVCCAPLALAGSGSIAIWALLSPDREAGGWRCGACRR